MIVVCDIDGTISDHSHRIHHVIHKPKDYEAYYSKMSDDPPIADAQRMLPALVRHEGDWLMFLTGRPERFRQQTRDWINKHFDVPPPMGTNSMTFVRGFSSLLMRPDEDHRPARVYKEGWARAIRSVCHGLIVFIDDDLRNSEMLTGYGVVMKAPECWETMR